MLCCPENGSLVGLDSVLRTQDVLDVLCKTLMYVVYGEVLCKVLYGGIQTKELLRKQRQSKLPQVLHKSQVLCGFRARWFS